MAQCFCLTCARAVVHRAKATVRSNRWFSQNSYGGIDRCRKHKLLKKNLIGVVPNAGQGLHKFKQTIEGLGEKWGLAILGTAGKSPGTTLSFEKKCQAAI
eukprot:417007-Prorocentrum_minimum.AAC.4